MNYQKILDFWFKENKSKWFVKSDDFDNVIKNEFLGIHRELTQGLHATWEEAPSSMLAMIIVLDQFSRNMFRGEKDSFASDFKARTLAKKSIIKGYDQALDPEERVFIYLPFEHSENIKDQEESMRLFKKLKEENPKYEFYFKFADQHYQIIKQFGRFPHRNKILERVSTTEELEFLKQKGSSF